MNAELSAYLALLPPPKGQAQAAWAGAVSPGTPFWKQLHEAGLVWRCALLFGTHLLGTGLLLVSWACIGFVALSGRWDPGWLLAWALALASTVPMRLTTRWLEGVLAVGFGGLLRQRLFAGALRTDSESIRERGAGALLSEILEVEAIDSVGVSAGLQASLALLELLVAPVLLWWGAAGVLQSAFLAGWVVLFAALLARNLRQRAEWSKLRLKLTQALVENMTAHRTRLVQQAPSEWHLAEDREVERYAEASARLDRSTARIEAGLPRGYALVAVLLMTPSLFSGDAAPVAMAVTLGTLLFVTQALERLALGFSEGAAAWVAWRLAQPMFDAAADRQGEGSRLEQSCNAGPALQCGSLSFTHRARTEPMLRGCTFSMDAGERLLIQGDSGSGKSTLAALLAGLRQPASGFVLAGGLDRFTLGDFAWRQRIALAPQYHENHILSASLGFNLLLARPYPHSPDDYAEATALCYELGLETLIDRMPAGLHQIVGETGWRLSQGERSRVFLARALLQNADVVVLDESLAALDPENLQRCLESVMRRVKTLIVIAHS